MTNIFSLDNISPVYVHTGAVVLVIVGLFVALAAVRKLAAWVKGPSQRSAYSRNYQPTLSRGARKQLASEGIKTTIGRSNNTYRHTRNRRVNW